MSWAPEKACSTTSNVAGPAKPFAEFTARDEDHFPVAHVPISSSPWADICEIADEFLLLHVHRDRRWTFTAPLGYLNAPRASGKSLVLDPERGPLVRRAFEELASARFTKQEIIARATEAGLRSRRGLTLTPQSFGQMMRNPIYIGKVQSPDFGVSTVGDFEPLVNEATFHRAQAVMDGRVLVTGPRRRNHPDFPLRGFVRCESCGRPLTGSWSNGRAGRYAYYHCQRQCRAVNVSKATLEDAFADELALLQPTAGYMRLVTDRILYLWEQRRAEAKDRTEEQAKRVKAIQLTLDRLDEAFLFAQSIDSTSYERQRDRLREEMTFAQIDHHADATDELDVQGILAFAERIPPCASDLWVQASLDYTQRLQALFFPEGIAYDGNRFNRTAVTTPVFNYLVPPESADERVVSPEGIEAWVRRSANRLTAHDFWLQVVDSEWVSHYSAFDGRARPST